MNNYFSLTDMEYFKIMYTVYLILSRAFITQKIGFINNDKDYFENHHLHISI